MNSICFMMSLVLANGPSLILVFHGTLNNLQFDNLRLNTSSNTRVYGDLNFKNLISKTTNDFEMQGVFSNLSSNYRDLKSLLPNVLGASIPSIFGKLGNFNINGTTKITTTKIDADLDILTQIGIARSNLSISNVNNIETATYKGKIIFDDFNIGKFLEDPNLGKISANLEVDGKGFKKENLSSRIKGDVYSINYNKYDYKNINVNGTYQQSVFNGALLVDDKNLKLDFNGLADFSKAINAFDFTANIEYLNLKALNFYNRDETSEFKGIVEMNMRGTSLDDAVGNISFNTTNYKNENDDYYFDDFQITSSFKDKERFITINSPRYH
ncbi:hypothetical protein N7U66_03935 [Lacinutrix neustonica]|uniref:Uncharacterized protein n=1 Tax=Lacinutrix neustonica TaxID=2980107 RepID=A0A9E8SHL2_9FLAO|nr:hypothetical protein [Lacinutrix neustonica]WAC02810.1 hypothetical protein N7U66_03935 [Lacinutrix neustonica]